MNCLRIQKSCATVVLFATFQFGWSQAYFVGVGDLSGGAVSSTVTDMSADGSVIVGESESDLGTSAYKWSRGSGIQSLGDLDGGGHSSTAKAIDSSGQFITGSSLSSLGREAFLWNAKSGMQPLGTLPSFLVYSEGLGVANGGSRVVGYAHIFDGNHPLAVAAEWTPSHGWTDRYPTNAGPSHFDCMNDNGSYAYIAQDFSLGYGNWWAYGTSFVGQLTYLGGNGGPFYRITGCGPSSSSSDHLVLASRSVSPGSAEVASIFRAGTWSPLAPRLGQVSSTVLCSDSLGSFLGGQATYQSGSEAVFWDSSRFVHSFKDFLLSKGVVDVIGWKLTSIEAVSVDGRYFCGNGINPLGQPAAWYAYVPEGTLRSAFTFLISSGTNFGGGLQELQDSDGQFLFVLAESFTEVPTISIAVPVGPHPSQYTPNKFRSVVTGNITHPDCGIVLRSKQGSNWTNVWTVPVNGNFVTVADIYGAFYDRSTTWIELQASFVPVTDLESVDGWLVGIDFFGAISG